MKSHVVLAAGNSRAAIAYSADDGRALALLLLPFLIVSIFLAINHTMKPAIGSKDAARSRPIVAMPEKSVAAMLARTPLSLPGAAPEGLQQLAALAPPQQGAIELPLIRLPGEAPQIAGVPADVPLVTAFSMPAPPFALPATPPKFETAITPGSMIAVPARVAFILPPPPFALPATAPPVALPGNISPAGVCRPAPKRAAAASLASAADFGMELATAAQAQLDDFVIYSATYKRIAYPMGDIPSLYGSCSDVVIRAYRALGIDLQELVQRARVGSGDPSIDHRRTETLRMFFSRHGNVLPVTTFPEDYKPGDIVTYYRPFSRVSRAHIAIVSSELGPSGRPMIVHNRGWGPQLEDALFVDRITGHYRFNGAAHNAASSPTLRGGHLAVQRPALGSFSGAKHRNSRVAAKS